MRIGECNSAARLFAADKWVLKIVDGGPLSLLIDFANESVKSGAMSVLGLTNIHSA